MGNSTSGASSKLPPLIPVTECVTEKMMGTWFVQGVKPTMLETTCSNAVERYSMKPESSSSDINIDFQYNKDTPITSALKSLPQKGWVVGPNKSNSGEWKVSPLWPIKMPYLILEVDDKDYEYTVIGYPSRAYCWIMSRHPIMSNDTYEMLKHRLEQKHQYDLSGLRRVPQIWTAEERTKRGLSTTEIPDSMLVKPDQIPAPATKQ